MRISLCITCKGRLWQLKQTLPKNLEDVSGFPNVEFVVVDYASEDGLKEWVVNTMTREVGKRLVYGEVQGQGTSEFRRSHAKNCAHLLATGDVLVNLDADNFVGRGYVQFLDDYFSRGYSLAVTNLSFLTKLGESAGGRLAISKDLFLDLGGYDEEFIGYGYEDMDLRERASRFGCKVVTTPAEFIAALPDDDIKTKCRFHSVPYARSVESNLKRLKSSAFSNRIVANQGGKWGVAKIVRNFEGDPIEVGYP